MWGLDPNIKFAVEHKAIQLITSIIKEDINDDVVAEACAALQNLALLEENLTQIKDCGGIRLIVGAMETHTGSAHVQKKAW